MQSKTKRMMSGYLFVVAGSLLIFAGCASQGSDAAAAPELAAEAPEAEPGQAAPGTPPIDNPTVAFDGRTYYLNEDADPALPSYLRVACYDIHLLDPPHALLVMDGRKVRQVRPAVGRYGYLGDVTGNGVDEVITMREPMTTGMNVMPFYPRVQLAFSGDASPALQAESPETPADAVEMIVYRQGEQLTPIYQEPRSPGRRVTIGGRWQQRSADVQDRPYSLATTHGRRRLWADLYGDGRPVWCDIDGQLETLTTRDGKKYHRLTMELVAYWRYDRSAGVLDEVPVGRTVFSPVGEELFLGKLKGCLAEQAPPRTTGAE